MALSKQEVFARAARGELRAPQLIPGFQGNDDGLVNRTPIDNSVFGTLGAGGKAEIDAAVKVARACFDAGTWRDKSPAERKTVMLKWCDLLQEHAGELAALDCIDAGKPIDECENTDIPATIDTLRWYAEAADKVYGRIAPTGPNATGLIVKEPVGVVGAVLPWNFPARVGVNVEFETVAALAKLPNIVGIKESSGNFSQALRMLQAGFRDFEVICGCDDQPVDFFFWGCTSWIAGAGNVFPGEQVALHAAAMAGRWDEARALMRRMYPALQSMESGDYNQKAKAGCLNGTLDAGDVRPPLAPLDAAAKERFRALVRKV
jgi:hypothetical protein